MHDEASLRALLHVLTGGADGDTVCGAIARGFLADCAIIEATLHRRRADALVLAGAYGVSPARRRWCAALPADAPVPEQHVMRDGEPLVFTAEQLRLLPVRRHLEVDAPGTLVLIPIRWQGYIAGVAGLRASGTIHFDAAMQRRLDGLADALALWLAQLPDERPERHSEAPLLNERQRQVIAGIRRGMTNAAIAAELGFAVGTIKADITAMSALFGASGRADLLRKVDAAYA